MPHLLPTAASTLAACRPSQSFHRLLLPAAAHTHAACCRAHATAAAYFCMYAVSTTAPASTAASAAAGAMSIDSFKKVSINLCD
jgi:hypothetical protein